MNVFLPPALRKLLRLLARVSRFSVRGLWRLGRTRLQERRLAREERARAEEERAQRAAEEERIRTQRAAEEEHSRITLARLDDEIQAFWHHNASRSVIFLHYSYYNFLYLARALRKRGWNAINVIWDEPNHPDRFHLHGADIELYETDHGLLDQKIDFLVDFVRQNVRMVHFAGVGRMSFYPKYMDSSFYRKVIPEDFLALNRAGVKFGYTHTGCCDLVSQTAFYRWSGGMCDFCHWQHSPENCSDLRNLAWGHAVQLVCELICTETDPMLDYKAHPAVFREPLTLALDSEHWDALLKIPERFRVDRRPDEILVLHAMGNYEWRRRGTDNVKGSAAVFRAIENLQRRGIKVRLLFFEKVPNVEMRFLQLQADIVIDQLRYGRYGAFARESLMLGKPTVGCVNPHEEIPGAESQCVLECPIVHATPETLEQVLADLISSPERRAAIGAASRAYAIKWWSSDACAARYEQVYDRIMAGLPPVERPVVAQCPTGR